LFKPHVCLYKDYKVDHLKPPANGPNLQFQWVLSGGQPSADVGIDALVVELKDVILADSITVGIDQGQVVGWREKYM
jgi:hypothetical protein